MPFRCFQRARFGTPLLYDNEPLKESLDTEPRLLSAMSQKRTLAPAFRDRGRYVSRVRIVTADFM